MQLDGFVFFCILSPCTDSINHDESFDSFTCPQDPNPRSRSFKSYGESFEDWVKWQGQNCQKFPRNVLFAIKDLQQIKCCSSNTWYLKMTMRVHVGVICRLESPLHGSPWEKFFCARWAKRSYLGFHWLGIFLCHHFRPDTFQRTSNYISVMLVGHIL